MAHAGRRPTAAQTTPSPRTRRLRRHASSQVGRNYYPNKRCVSQPTLSSSDIEQSRPVLVPLHPNLRRLPSRILVSQDPSKGDIQSTIMRQHSYGTLHAGAKRKRVFSANENAVANGRYTRNSGRSKRLRSAYTSSDENATTDQSEMDVDASTISIGGSDESEEEEEDILSGDGDTFEDNSTDEYLINTADQKELNRLRKTDLIRLYNMAGLREDPETLTKTEIGTAIIDARDDYVSVPPSSLAGKSSDCSSDDGNVAGDEGTDTGGFDAADGPALNLRRRATIHELGKSNPITQKGRSFSLGNIATHNGITQTKTRYRVNSNESVGSRSKASTSPSPTSSVGSAVWAFRSPPATRLRSRQVSQIIGNKTDNQKIAALTQAPSSKPSKGKAKGKQVGFKSDVHVHIKTPIWRSKTEGSHNAESFPESSDLEKFTGIGGGAPQPSPRRLRSKDRQQITSDSSAPSQSCLSPKKQGQARVAGEDVAKKDRKPDRHSGRTKTRVTPIRRAKVKSEDSKEAAEEDASEEDELAEDDESEDIGSQDEEGEEEDEEGEGEEEEDETEDIGEVDQESEEEEIDELASSASAGSSPRSRRTPLRKRLRPRRNQGSAGPSDGDDEGDGGHAPCEREAQTLDAEDETGDNIDDDAEDDAASEITDDAETIAVEPRRLRNGKIVGEEDIDMSVGEEDTVEEGEEEDAGSGEIVEDEGEAGDEDADGETDEEIMDEEVDLTIATAKTLVRLRRDDLVRLCESRDLDPIGTKPQLAQALLQWRDRQASECSSPSSAGTVRPPSTTKRHRYHTRHQSSELQTPILSRSLRVHLDEPRTPAPGKVADQEKDKEGEQDLELDLESLGLEDREIPPDKLQKLEKIGSGGFKDVYIGKFKGRKIAIAEFRGQLNAMDIKELKLLGEFDHSNIVRFLGVSIPENTRETPVMIVSELCSNGDLFDYIRNVNAPSLRKILVMMLDIARGLEYLHTRKPSVIHRDCKSSNILITSKGTAKIADFGLAKVKQSTRSMVRSLVGTVNWQAPELWHAHPKYNHKVDVFSCAMVYWEILQWYLPKVTRKFPWEGMNEHAIYEIVGTKRQRPSTSGLRKQWGAEIVDLIEHMWMHDPQDRPTMSEVVQRLDGLEAGL